MEEFILRQFAYRTGYISSNETICDGCFRIFENGEIGFRCMECSGYMLPESTTRNVRLTDVTATVLGRVNNNGLLAISNTTPYYGYDLCLICAKNRTLHRHHQFTLMTYQMI
ncbi:unnamed protein product [Adineta steineri]|uniref:Uncharacterized protein n=1 Tax=Adineta steineri TaxID=433720 RepID=A0A816DGR9_9BILA|nr:unnamed protein product [Adineta steineri]CAF1637159.1 unnamed protein product [Adineta steineri]